MAYDTFEDIFSDPSASIAELDSDSAVNERVAAQENKVSIEVNEVEDMQALLDEMSITPELVAVLKSENGEFPTSAQLIADEYRDVA